MAKEFKRKFMHPTRRKLADMVKTGQYEKNQSVGWEAKKENRKSKKEVNKSLRENKKQLKRDEKALKKINRKK